LTGERSNVSQSVRNVKQQYFIVLFLNCYEVLALDRNLKWLLREANNTGRSRQHDIKEIFFHLDLGKDPWDATKCQNYCALLKFIHSARTRLQTYFKSKRNFDRNRTDPDTTLALIIDINLKKIIILRILLSILFKV
jgi:hypothetical protein